MKTTIYHFLLMALPFSAIAQNNGVNFIPDAKEADVQKRRIFCPAGLFTTERSNIYGISTGYGSHRLPDSDGNFVRSNGIRIEPLSEALFYLVPFMAPDGIDYPKPNEIDDFKKLQPNETVNGVNLSSGTIGFININGISISGVAQSINKSNGISLAAVSNSSFQNNGIQIAMGDCAAVYSNGILISYLGSYTLEGNGLMAGCFNEYVKFNGLQIGFLNDIENKSETFTGLQIGVYNSTKKLRGVQLGLMNVNEKRTLPLINWNFKKA